jgi:hypothetical protein
VETSEEWARICGGDDILRLDKKHAAYACVWETWMMEEIIFALADGLASWRSGQVGKYSSEGSSVSFTLGRSVWSE